MAREYVTIRGEEKNGKTIWRETSVGPMDVKSIVARALRLPSGDIGSPAPPGQTALRWTASRSRSTMGSGGPPTWIQRAWKVFVDILEL